MAITTDWHIHSHNSCDSANLPIRDLMLATEIKGITDFGISDHLHTPYNLNDIAKSRREFDENNPSERVHFGIEVSVVSQWELDQIAIGNCEYPVFGIREGGTPGCCLAIGLEENDIGRYGIEYVIGGVHWPLYVAQEREIIIRDYHRQNMFLASHPMVTIIAHPWWWMDFKFEGYHPWEDADGVFRSEPWFDDFDKIPSSMHEEFIELVHRYGKIVEINVGVMLLTAKYTEEFKIQYLEYLAYLKESGVRLSIGTDCHTSYDADLAKAEKLLNSVGIKAQDLWKLTP